MPNNTESEQQTTEAEVETTTQADVSGASENSDTSKEQVQAGNETVNDVEFTDTDKDMEGQPETKPAESKPQQDNSANARRRRETEHKAELKHVRLEGIKTALDGINPYTQEKLETDLDVEQYLEMKEIEKNGGDPVKDYAKFVNNKRKEEQKVIDEKAKNDEFARSDYADFHSKYPDVNIEELFKDDNFRAYAEERVFKEPMANIYGGYRKLIDSIVKKEKETVARQIASSKATPGSLGGNEAPPSEFFTKEEVKKMTPEEVHIHFDKIRKSMAKW